MEKISVREILLRYGKRWMTSKELANLVAEKGGYSIRHAYNLIKKAYKDKEIQKHRFPDGTVIYGVSSEFGPPFWKFDTEEFETEVLKYSEKLFEELSQANDIPAKIKSNHITDEMLKLLSTIEEREESLHFRRLNWAIRITMESTQPRLLWEKIGLGEDKIREYFAEANQLDFYRRFVTSYAFQKLGFKRHYEMAIRISEWQPNTLVKDDYAMKVLEPYSKPEKCFILTVSLAKWLDPSQRIRRIILGSEETRVLLMSPFAEDNTWRLFQEEYVAPLKPMRFLHPYWKDLFRRICSIMNNLYALLDLASYYKILIRMYKDFKPPLRFTLLPGKIATIFPTPFRLAGDLYTFCGKVTDPEILQEIENKFLEIWEGPTREVRLDSIELKNLTESLLRSYIDYVKRENLITRESFNQLKMWAKSHGQLANDLFTRFEQLLEVG
jgi:hypothetical protein